MPRPCKHNPPMPPEECIFCRWCLDRSANGRAYRERWGEAEPFPVPIQAGQRRCVHLGEPTGEQIACGPCGGKTRLKLFACRVYGKCTQGKKTEGVACCTGCPDFAATLAYQLEVTAWGIGDHLLALTSAAGLVQQHPLCDVVFVPNSNFVRLAQGLAWLALFRNFGRISLEPVQGAITYRPHTSLAEQCRDGPRWEHYGNTCGVFPVLPEVAPLPREAIAWARHYRGCVVLAPWTASDLVRRWPLEHWQRLEQILKSSLYRTVVIDNVRSNRNDCFSSEKVLGQHPCWIAALLLESACLVGVDSGMAHVAGLLGSDAVVLCQVHPGHNIYGFYPRVRVMQGVLANIRPESVADMVYGITHRKQEILSRSVLSEKAVHRHHPQERADLYSSVDGGSVEIETGEMLAALVRTFKPELVLETGTFLGVAARIISEAMTRNGFGRLITLEMNANQANIARASLADLANVEVVTANALAWLNDYQGPPFGLVFLDSDASVRPIELALLHENGLAIGPVMVHDTSRLRAAGGMNDCPGYPVSLDALGLGGVECHGARGWRLFDLRKP